MLTEQFFQVFKKVSFQNVGILKPNQTIGSISYFYSLYLLLYATETEMSRSVWLRSSQAVHRLLYPLHITTCIHKPQGWEEVEI